MTTLKRRQVYVEAQRHDGTNARALLISGWVNDQGGKALALLKGTSEISKDYAVVRLLDNVLTNLVVPGFWVVDLTQGKFVAVPDSIIHDAYDIIEGEPI